MELDKDAAITALRDALERAVAELSDATSDYEVLAAEYEGLSDDYLKLGQDFLRLRETHSADIQRAGGLVTKLMDDQEEIIERTTPVLDVMDRLMHERKLMEQSGALAGGLETVNSLSKLLVTMGVATPSVQAPKTTVFLAQIYSEEKRLQDDSQRHITNYISVFARVAGDRPLNEYTRQDIVKWVRTLEKLKASLGKSPADETKTIKQLLVESRGKPTMGETTIGKHIAHVKAMFVCAIKHYKFGHPTDISAMFDKIELSDWVPSAQKRKIWTIEQLSDLFRSPTWSGTRSRVEDRTRRHEPGPHFHRDAYWWLPVLALWTGGRLEELAQLHHEDLLHDQNGLPFLKIHDDGVRRLKTEHSIRNVPVHPFLVEIGFLELFRAGRARSKRIFPELKPTGRLEKLGDTYSSHFTDYRREVGLYERLRDFHSLRRTFITTLRSRYRVDPLTVAAIAGHDDDHPELRRVQQTEDYTDYDIADLANVVALIDYPGLGLDVSNLTRRHPA